MVQYTLEICTENEDISNFYLSRCNYNEDSGVDLFVPEDVTVKGNEVFFLSHKIICRLVDEEGKTYPYFLYPRSSISKTPLMLANSVGIIDKNYRGNIIAALRNTSGENTLITQGTRLVQICAPDLSPIRVKLVETIDSTERGSNGFGSTGK
jgi:dUTP pyrophosphatase